MLLRVSVILYLSLLARAYIVINTWSGDFEAATTSAFAALANGASALDAIEVGGSTCEAHQCDTSVGFGNHPDTRAHTSLDALIMNGTAMDAGSVGYVRKYRQAIRLARYVMEYTSHTLLVGEGAEDFADMMGMTPVSATTKNTLQEYSDWRSANCQPNYYTNMINSTSSCGPYTPVVPPATSPAPNWASSDNHDTIGLVAIDATHAMACGTSTNGANHKVAGRVGDSPIVGAGGYVTSHVGGAAATGDGDVMMRFMPSFVAVQHMSAGSTPSDACEAALRPIIRVFPTFSGAVVCLSADGKHGAATYNMQFSYSVQAEGMEKVQVINVPDMKQR